MRGIRFTTIDWVHYEAMKRLLEEWAPCSLVLDTELGMKIDEVTKEVYA